MSKTSKLPLDDLLKATGIPRKRLAAYLFPGHKRPYQALYYLVSRHKSLSTDQALWLATYLGLSLDEFIRADEEIIAKYAKDAEAARRYTDDRVIIILGKDLTRSHVLSKTSLKCETIQHDTGVRIRDLTLQAWEAVAEEDDIL